MADRAEAADRLAPRFADHAAGVGLEDEPSVAYRPRSSATTVDELAGELAERTDGDLERGFTGHGPHRDDLVFKRARRDLRTYGSRGQQRLGLLALLLAEREELAAERGAPPLMLLDDVMSELDAGRRARLVDVLQAGGQSVIATTDLGHVPGAEGSDVERVAITDGRVLQEAEPAAEHRAAG
jgi:DNA replication and repair protein RecF